MSEQTTGAEGATTESSTVAVTMTDGRIVHFGEKTKMKKDYGYDAERGLVWNRIDFANGETVEVWTDPNSELGRQALGHGIGQKLGDSAAGADSIESAFEAVLEMGKRLQNGEWAKAREGGGTSAKGASELVQALVKVMGVSVDEVRNLLATLSASDKAALRKVDKVAAAIEEIKAAKAPSKADKERAERGQALLAALTGTTPAE